MSVPLACSNCGITVVHAGGRCVPCWDYWRRTGKERPQGLIVKMAKRRLADDHARQARLARICGDVVYIGPEAWTECEMAPSHLGDLHESWFGQWYWDREGNLVMTRKHKLLVELGA